MVVLQLVCQLFVEFGILLAHFVYTHIFQSVCVIRFSLSKADNCRASFSARTISVLLSGEKVGLPVLLIIHRYYQH